MSERSELAKGASKLVLEAIVRLEVARDDLIFVVGSQHDATGTAEEAIRMARILDAKLARLLRRIP